MYENRPNGKYQRLMYGGWQTIMALLKLNISSMPGSSGNISPERNNGSQWVSAASAWRKTAYGRGLS